MKGEAIEDWANHQAQQLEKHIHTTRPNHVADSDEALWTKFKAVFKSAWKDGAKVQSTYEQLMKLTMKELNIDGYIATFSHLAATAGWDPNTQRMINRFS